MINYYKILEMHLQGISQRIIPSSTGHSRDKDSILSIAFHLSHLCGEISQLLRSFEPPSANKKAI